MAEHIKLKLKFSPILPSFAMGVFIIVATILRLVIARHEAIPCNKAIPIGWGLLRQATQGSQ